MNEGEVVWVPYVYADGFVEMIPGQKSVSSPIEPQDVSNASDGTNEPDQH